MMNPGEHNIDKAQYKRLDQYKHFFTPTIADGQEDYYSPIRPLIGPETSSANIEEREDIPSFIKIGQTVQEMFANGQDDLALLLETIFTMELELTRSIDGKVLDNIFSNKMEYSQTQNVHEYTHVPERKGFFGGK
jgi:predicted RNase H-like HicB family nuclease